ncbi:unnamed protein product [Rotaria sordida]|uniref:IBR domain-containing protein n=1 Tax=Rotaria sordida TaxID=392033 RepID=A0A819D175_9BILA|nr:unnamed protein product [Rotaria sordida]
MTEFVWCAHECGSGQLHDLEGFSSPEVICIKCQLRTCFTHRTIWHTGITCAEYDLQQSQLPDDGTCAWLDQNTKRCPQCRCTNENYWECEEYLINNEESIKRCQNCGKLRYGHLSRFSGKFEREQTTDEEDYD